MKRKLTSFAAAGALLLAGAGYSAAQAQGSYAGGSLTAPGYDYGAYGYDYGYGYGYGPGPIGALIAAPAVAAAGVVGAAATIAAAPIAAAGALAAAPFAGGYYAAPYYDVSYYGPAYRPVGWGYNYGPTYVAWRGRPIVRRGFVMTRGPYRSVRYMGPVRAIHGRPIHPVHMRQIHMRPMHLHQAQARSVKVMVARAN